MSDIGIFIFGCCVFGVVLAATMVSILGPAQPDIDEQKVLRSLRDENAKNDPSQKLAS